MGMQELKHLVDMMDFINDPNKDHTDKITKIKQELLDIDCHLVDKIRETYRSEWRWSEKKHYETDREHCDSIHRIRKSIIEVKNEYVQNRAMLYTLEQLSLAATVEKNLKRQITTEDALLKTLKRFDEFTKIFNNQFNVIQEKTDYILERQLGE